MAIQHRGLTELIRKFDNLRGGLNKGLTGAGDKAADIALKAVPGYPPAPPGSTYERTFALGESITNEPGGIGASINSLGREILSVGVPYGPYVVNEPTQAKIHRGRWWTIQQISKKIRPDVIKTYIDAIKDLLSG